MVAGMQPTAAPVSYAPKLTRLAKTVAIALLQTTSGWAKPEQPKPWGRESVLELTPELAALGDVEFKLLHAAPAAEQFAAQIKATGQVPQRFDEPPVLKDARNVTPRERDRIRELYRAGVRIADIVRRTRRSDSVVTRTVRGMKRKKPSPPAINVERDAAMLAAGGSLREIGVEFGFAAAYVGGIVRKEKRKRRG
jgi:hypothetical protein